MLASTDPLSPAATASFPPARPADVPEKFWDAKAGCLRTEALLKSYLELERRLARSVVLPENDDDQEGHKRLRRALGVPETPDAYAIEASSDILKPDADLNAVLHEAGFTQRQVQLVYDLAAERVLPLISQAVAEVEAERQIERLASRFGGEQAWRERSRQLAAWGKANLPQDVFETLSRSVEGIVAMSTMMQASEPVIGTLPGSVETEGSTSASLQTMIGDPRYWRDRDPVFVAKVTAGFRRLYGE
ncbi:capsid assembly protein [Marinivivus vitaminiproducens]|uniref:capsid assembly protein n=1 Tax=Marinivivus vitaminiproducens TaxID=3035935 RepID=UPI0027A2D79D|nr:hypothetical protein P4R82_04900 [Geminicoccaceae bacterium SCSIO 64248]